MSLIDLASQASHYEKAWQSAVLAKVGDANIKLMRMDQLPYAEEIHHFDEVFLVVEGQMLLQVAGDAVTVNAGQMYVVPSGVPHSVRIGSFGTLVLVDV